MTKTIFIVLGVFLMSSSIISCSGEKDKKDGILNSQEIITEKEYPYNIPWVNELAPAEQEWLILTEDKCEAVKGRAGDVTSHEEWKRQLWEKHCQ